MTTQDPQNEPAAGLGEPLFFERVALTKVWGGRSLEEVLGLELGVDGPVGETWELSDRPEHVSVVRGGSFAGRTLHELVRAHRAELCGEAGLNEDGRFPLLVKYLSASKPLSVQVHPDDSTAAKLHAGDSGKDEAWYILHAEPGSLVYLGLRPEVDAESFASMAGGEGVVDALQPWPVRAGDVVDVPAGTLHAIGEGVTLVEIQQASDVTYRLYDWGRVGLDGSPRAMHVEEALLAMDYEAPIVGPFRPELVEQQAARRAPQVVSRPTFQIELLELDAALECDTEDRPRVYVPVSGKAALELASGARHELGVGDTCLAPASLGKHTLSAGPEPARLIVVTTKT